MTGETESASAFEAWDRRRRQEALLEDIETTVRLAEELSWPPAAPDLAERIREEVIPGLLGARTYVEVGQVRAPEVREALSAARLAAAEIADRDRSFARLVSRLRTLAEDTDTAARGA